MAQLATEGQVRLSDQFIQVAGDAAYELGVEHGQFRLAGQPVTGDYRVTNIYRRESGAWKIVHHHTDAVQSMKMCSAVWGRKHEIDDGLIVLTQILVGEALTVIGARLLGAGSAYSDMSS